MRILFSCMVLSCMAGGLLAADEHRPKHQRKDDRNKRNLGYSVSHHYAGPHSFRLERRISTAAGSQLPIYQSQFFPGPRPPYTSYRKDGHNELTRPEDLLTDNNHLNEQVYGPPPHKHIIERPVYIKEPEPIIEIIIKESNVSLPPLPTSPPPKKKKEQVQVFYVKYKKNPNGHGKDAVIYDKPIPALTPNIGNQEEEDVEAPHNYHSELVTLPPPPSTTLRTIIKPDSETYHSPSGVKVTFGKEGFDYDKRSSKPEDYSPTRPRQNIQFPQPQGRQLTSFSSAFFKTPTTNQQQQPHFSNPPSFRSDNRQPQSYRPFNSQFKAPNPPPSFGQRQPPPPKYPFQSPPYTKPVNNQFSGGNFQPQFGQTISHPPPPQFQQQNFQSNYHQSRQPVPYKPFDNFRPATEVRPDSYRPQPDSYQPQPDSYRPQNVNVQFRPETHFQQTPVKTNFRYSQQLPKNEAKPAPQFTQQRFNPQVEPQQPLSQNEHLNNLQTAQSILPPGGQLIQSLPKYEQHISVLEPTRSPPKQVQVQQHQPQALPLQTQSSTYLSSQQTNNQYSQENSKVTKTPINPISPQDQLKQQQQILEQQQLLLQQQQQFLQQRQNIPKNHQSYHSTSEPIYQTRSPTSFKPSTTTTTTVKPTTTTQAPSTTTKDPNVLNLQLPDEVPDDLRQQLLSSGILNNADISVLDYDKVGDIPLSALPPDQLANFYGAGGAQQLATAGSEPVPSIARAEEEDQVPAGSEHYPTNKVQMKVVHYDPQTDRGQQVQDAYVKQDAKQVNPVVLNDNTYNRYLPLKVNGTQFPIPDVPELKGKKISSVVVLAPVTYDFSSTRKARHANPDEAEKLIQGVELKELLKNPTLDNYRKFLASENKTRSDKQAVILLVTNPTDDNKTTKRTKEIFMYDIATQTVSKLSGELSSAFVDAAEANATDDEEATASSNIVETRVPYNGEQIDRQDFGDIVLDGAGSDLVESKVPIIDPMSEADMEGEASEQLERFVDISGMRVVKNEDLAVAASQVSIKGGA